jgi:hypothetical protein
MLTKADDYPVHQLPEPIATSGTDRNFYDRYFFNGYTMDGQVFFAAALGVYPHLNVMDAAFSVIENGVQHNLRASRLLRSERMDTKVGPISIEVVEPLEEAAFAGRRQRTRHLGRSPVRGARECGGGTALHLSPRAPHGDGLYAADAERRLRRLCEREGQAHRYRRHDGRHARPLLGRAAHRARRSAAGSAAATAAILLAVGAAQFCGSFHALSQQCGSERNPLEHGLGAGSARRRGAGAYGALRLRDRLQIRNAAREERGHRNDAPDGGAWRAELTPRFNFYMSGIGYMHPEWGHGHYKGENALGYDTYDLASVNENDPRFWHVQAFCTARLIGPRDGTRGSRRARAARDRPACAVRIQRVGGYRAVSGASHVIDPPISRAGEVPSAARRRGPPSSDYVGHFPRKRGKRKPVAVT